MGYVIFAIALLATAVVYSCAAMSGRCSRNEEADRKRTTDNRCVCCGAEIPEGRWICPNCERKGYRDGEDD